MQTLKQLMPCLQLSPQLLLLSCKALMLSQTSLLLSLSVLGSSVLGPGLELPHLSLVLPLLTLQLPLLSLKLLLLHKLLLSMHISSSLLQRHAPEPRIEPVLPGSQSNLCGAVAETGAVRPAGQRQRLTSSQHQQKHLLPSQMPSLMTRRLSLQQQLTAVSKLSLRLLSLLSSLLSQAGTPHPHLQTQQQVPEVHVLLAEPMLGQKAQCLVQQTGPRAPLVRGIVRKCLTLSSCH